MSASPSTPLPLARQSARSAGLSRYYTGKPCASGHTDYRLVSNGTCLSCVRARKKKNRGKLNEAQQLQRKASAERWREISRSQYWRHVGKNRERARNRARNKASRKAKLRVKYADPIQRGLANRMRCRMWSALRTGKGKPLEGVLGYSVAALKRHLERQFTKGMSWDNWSQWHIDHIVPVVSYTFTSYDDPELRACWALTNLRPLWKGKNREKSYHRTHLL